MAVRMKYLFTLAVPLAAVGAGFAWMLGLGGASTDGLVYDTAEVSRGEIRKIVTTSGPVRALVTVSIGSQLSGQIKDVLADFNSEVKAGDTLAVIDAKTFQARVAQGKADLAAARAQLINQEAARTKAEAVLKLAERTTTRQEALASRGYAAQATLDTALRDADVARADIEVAKAQIEAAKATVAQRQAALDQAQIDLDRTVITSSIEGTVISRTVDPGQTVAASLQSPELFKIAQDLRRIRIEAQVNEADVGAVAEGNPVVFTVDAYPDRQFEGRVTQVRLAATELNNIITYTVIIEAANEDRRLFPGMTANVQIEAAKREGVLRVPNDALRFRPRGDAPSASSRDQSTGEARADRLIGRLKVELQLSEEQDAALRKEIKSAFAELRGNGASGSASPDPNQLRQRVSATVQRVLAPLLTDAQRPLFEAWKAGRESVRSGAVWVLGAEGKPERRSVRLSISDDRFTEIAGGQLGEGDRVVLRAREVRK